MRYATAGVDIAAGEHVVELIRPAVSRTFGPEVSGGIGGFAGLFDAAKVAGMRRPLLATATDGVGTKVMLASRLGVYDTVGLDLVGMVVDDLVVCGAEPLFMTDYVVCGRVDPQRVATIVAGVARGCEIAGCALIGGETAEHPGHLAPEDFDLAGAATGVVEADRLLGADRVGVGDAVIAMASSGLHANGYSLVRRVVADLDLDGYSAELGRPLGVELLTPTRIYARDCLALAQRCEVHAFAHVTGGGLAANMARVLPVSTDAILDRSSWRLPPVFTFLARLGGVSSAEVERVFNCGIGMLAIVSAADGDHAIRVLAERDIPSWIVGEIVEGDGTARLAGQHPR